MAVGLGVCVETWMGVTVTVTVLVGVDVPVLVGEEVAVKGRAVSVNGSVGRGVIVLLGNGLGSGVRVETFGTQRISPGKIKLSFLQLTLFNKFCVV